MLEAGGEAAVSAQSPGDFAIDPASTGTFLVRFVARLIDIGAGIGAGCFASVVAGVFLGTLRWLGFSGSPDLHSAGNLIFGSFLFGIALAVLGAVCAQASSEAIAGTSLGKLLLGFRVVSLSGGHVFPCAPISALQRSIAFLADGLFFGYFAYLAMKESPLNQRMGDAWAETVVVRGSSLPPGAKQGFSRILTGLIAGFVVRVVFISLQLVLLRPRHR